jgi:hypothetical protein
VRKNVSLCISHSGFYEKAPSRPTSLTHSNSRGMQQDDHYNEDGDGDDGAYYDTDSPDNDRAAASRPAVSSGWEDKPSHSGTQRGPTNSFATTTTAASDNQPQRLSGKSSSSGSNPPTPKPFLKRGR